MVTLLSVFLIFLIFFRVKAMAETRLRCTDCGACGPADVKAKWIIEPDFKLGYMETRRDDQLPTTFGGG